MIKKRLTPNSDDDTDVDENGQVRRVKTTKSRNVVTKIINRSSSGYFNNSTRFRSDNKQFFHDTTLKICLKDIIPFRYLNDHIFMGLSACGNFLISYKRRCCELDSFDLNSGYKYELFFWIFRPHYPLSRYYTVNLFDDHGASDIKCVTMTQWSNDSNTIVIHGSSEIDDQHSFVSIVRVPKVNCLGCKHLHESDSASSQVTTPFRNLDLCMKCNLTVHTKYRYNESTQYFDPKIHLNVPGYVIMCENSIIHTLNVKLDMQKTKNVGCNVISSKYLRMSSAHQNSIVEEGQRNFAENSPQQNANSPQNVTEKSIVEQILDDFSEYDSDAHRLIQDISSQTASSSSSSLVTEKSCEKTASSEIFSKLPSLSGESSKSSITKPSSPHSPEQLEAAAKTYEFQEENEKCEKLSIFRKRRLADKKYEFNENTENIIPFNRTRNRTVRRAVYQSRTSPHPSFRSPCSSPIANRLLMSPPGFRSPSYYAYRSSPTHPMIYSPPTRYMRFGSECMSPASDDAHKYFSDIMNRMRENRCESGNESSHEDIKCSSSDSPTFSKKIVNFYVEEDDANSVVTCDDDDCISPGYHLSLPMEVHGAGYTKLQIVKKVSIPRLKGVPRAIITQNSFDVETFSIHVANKLCNKNNKKYGILFDLAFEIVQVCPQSQSLLCVLILQYIGSDKDRLSTCYNCSNGSDCYTHRKLFESTVLFSWGISGNEWKVHDYGQMKQLPSQMRLTHTIRVNRQEMLIKKLQRANKRIFGKDKQDYQNFDHLRILDSNEDKSKETLVDLQNGIEFYRRQPFESPSSISSISSNSSVSGASDSEIESGDELHQ